MPKASAKQAQTRRAAEVEPEPGEAGYLEWSRDPAVGLFVVVPLWLTYEILRRFYVPETMNLAEYWVKERLYTLPSIVLEIYGALMLVAVGLSAWSLLRREIPWLRVGLVVVLEGSVYGLMLGPLAAQMTHHSLPVLAAPEFGEIGALLETDPLVANLIGSLGAGIFEELVFRLLLLSSLGWLLMRASRTFGIHEVIGVGLAIIVSSLLFSLFHHVGAGAAPITPRVFVFRTMAGILLGVLFIARGLGVCVYTHAMYDIFYYLNAAEG